MADISVITSDMELRRSNSAMGVKQRRLVVDQWFSVQPTDVGSVDLVNGTVKSRTSWLDATPQVVFVLMSLV